MIVRNHVPKRYNLKKNKELRMQPAKVSTMGADPNRWSNLYPPPAGL